jgi:hypothetical protein
MTAMPLAASSISLARTPRKTPRRRRLPASVRVRAAEGITRPRQSYRVVAIDGAQVFGAEPLRNAPFNHFRVRRARAIFAKLEFDPKEL